jgi:phage shock protein A
MKHQQGIEVGEDKLSSSMLSSGSSDPTVHLFTQLREKEVEVEEKDRLLVEAAQALSKGLKPPDFARRNTHDLLKWALSQSALLSDDTSSNGQAAAAAAESDRHLAAMKRSLDEKHQQLQQTLDHMNALEQMNSNIKMSAERVEVSNPPPFAFYIF